MDFLVHVFVVLHLLGMAAIIVSGVDRTLRVGANVSTSIAF